MFDIGFSELLLIAIVALLVLGPERLPRAARFAGLWVRRARAQWHSVKSELESELADDELKRSLQRTRDELRDVQGQLQAQGRDLQQQFERERRQIEHEVMQPQAEPGHAVPAIPPDPSANPDSADPQSVTSQPADTGFTGAIDLDLEPTAPSSGDSAGHTQAATLDPLRGDAGSAKPAERPPPSWSRP